MSNLYSACLSLAVVFALSAEGSTADLLLDSAYGSRWGSPYTHPVDAERARRPEPLPPKPSRPAPALAPRYSPPAPALPERAEVRLGHRQEGPLTPPPGTVMASLHALQTAAGYVAQLVLFALCVLITSLVISNLRGIGQFIDRLFERTAQPEAPEVRAAGARDGLSLIDLQQLLQPEFSAADFRDQTKILRALKDELDAEAKSARATVRRERAQAEQQQTREDMP